LINFIFTNPFFNIFWNVNRKIFFGICFIIPKKYKFEDGTMPKDINDLAILLGVDTIPLNIINENLLKGKSGLIKLKMEKMVTK
jgi:hypothetical protein